MNHVLRRLGFVLAVGALVAAIFKEFSQPKGLRIGEGNIFGIPYSFRIPSMDNVRERYWNADGKLVAPPVLGVGFAPNLPAIGRKLGVM